MKSMILALAMAAPAFAVGFDTEGFGQSLTGWSKDRTATYKFTDATYRTYIPTLTATPGGGLYISTQVDLVAFASQGAISHIDMTFTADGTLISAQLRSSLAGKTIDTGIVRRPEPPAAPLASDGEEKPVLVTYDGTGELIFDLFNRYDAEMRKITEGKDAEKRDLFSRLGGRNSAKTANLPAGLRHNVNLMLQHVGYGRSSNHMAK